MSIFKKKDIKLTFEAKESDLEISLNYLNQSIKNCRNILQLELLQKARLLIEESIVKANSDYDDVLKFHREYGSTITIGDIFKKE